PGLQGVRRRFAHNAWRERRKQSMTDEHRADGVEDAFRLARSGNPETFAEWMGMAEIPLRRILRRFARAVDVEVVVQETLVRMWLLASDPEWVLEGNNASLKFAF